MLGIKVNLDVDVKKVSSPIYFQHRNECVRCGGRGSLIFVDRFGRECSREVNVLEHIKCKKCGKIFSILWEPKDGTNKMMPSAVDASVSTDFINMVNHLSLKNKGENSLS